MTSPQPPRPFQEPEPTGQPRLDALARLVAIVDRLRDPDGCPWDRAQTLQTLAPHVIEEAYETVEAIEAGDLEAVAEEMGDQLMGIVLNSRVAEQAGAFSLADVAARVGDKLLRRHPHVFGGGRASDAQEALHSWEAVKRAERAERGTDRSAMAGVPAALPALQRARRLGEKAIAAGFRWADVRGALDKVREEAGELAAAVEASGHAADESARLEGDARERVEAELGDLLLAGALLGAYLGVDPEAAARGAVRRFERRFRHMEAALGGSVAERPLNELLAAWEAAKAALGSQPETHEPGSPRETAGPAS